MRGKLRPDVRAIQLTENLVEKWNTSNDSLAMEERSANMTLILHIIFGFRQARGFYESLPALEELPQPGCQEHIDLKFKKGMQ